MSVVLLQTETKTEKMFYLTKPKKSIFIDLELREYPTFNLIYGFINHQQGIKLRKSIVSMYGDEQTHYKKYIRQMKWLDDLQYIAVRYYMTSHGWGRINPVDALSLSLFHRPTRHSFCEENYFDFDMVNAQLSVLLSIVDKSGIAIENIEVLREYCSDTKKCRQDIINHYSLNDIVYDDGCVVKAKEQAKKLLLRIAFGGHLYGWKKEFNVKRRDDLPFVTKMEKCLTAISKEIWNANPHIRQDLETDPDFQAKSEEEKMRSVTALFAQTWERIIQEECVAYLVRNYSVKIIDIVPSQDGMMVLKKQLKGVDIDKLLSEFSKVIKTKFDFNISWSLKAFDEAVEITASTQMPLDVYYDDLEKGERYIAELIAPAFKNEVKFCYNHPLKTWYSFNKSGIWSESKSPPITRIITQLQSYIDDEVKRCWAAVKSETDAEKKKKLIAIEKAVKKHYQGVGKPSYSKHLCEYLETYLRDELFVSKLNKTAGKFPFKDGMLDLKTNKFTKGFKYDDFITFTTQIEYLSLKTEKDKRNYLLETWKKITNNNSTHLDYYLSILGYALTGDASLEKAIYYIIDGTKNREGNNGKTFIFNLLMSIFPEYVRQVDIQAFEMGYSKAYKHLDKLRNVRIAFADEGTTKQVNASLIKKIGDGLVIEYEKMFGTTEYLNVMFKFICCSNHKFKVQKGEDAVFNRYRELVFASHFGKYEVDDPDNLLFIGNSGLTEILLTKYRDEIITLLIEYAVRYYKSGIPDIPAEYLSATKDTKLANNPFAVWWFKTYEVFADGRVSIEDILRRTNLYTDRDDVIDALKNIGLAYNKDLKGFTTGVGGKKDKKGGITGWRLREVDGGDEEEDAGVVE